MGARQALYKLVDEVPEAELGAAKRYLQYLRDMGDPVMRAIHEAPFDDEPETAKERKLVAEARAQIKRGDVIRDEDLARELGL